MTATELEEEARAIADEQPEVTAEPAHSVEIVRHPDQPAAELVPHGDADPVMGDLALIPTENELQTLARLASTFSAASIVPAPLRGKPNDVFLVLLTARDLNLSVTVALRECHVIDGRVTVSPKLKLATIRSRQLGRVWPDPNNSAWEATWYAQRADDPDTTYSSRFSWEQAATARLATKGCSPDNHKTQGCKCKSNWATYPERMLSWRAVGYLLDDVFGEVGTGLYSPDELGAITDEEGQPVLDVREVPPLDGMKGPQTRSGRTRAEGPPEAASAEDRARMQWTFDHLPPPALHAATKMWAENHLGKLEHLPANKVRTADALLDSIVKRATGGEWGAWGGLPDPPDFSQEGTTPVLGGAEQAGGPEPSPEGDESGEPTPETEPPEPGPVPEEDAGDAVCAAPGGCGEAVVIVSDEGDPWCEQHRPL